MAAASSKMTKAVESRSTPWVRPSLLQEKRDGKIQCNVCERRCLLVPGGWGWCRTRQNHHGELVTVIYGAVSSLTANPIEKKPLYHFFPGSFALTAGSWSCNFGCPWCQNWEISKVAPPTTCDYRSPEAFLAAARRARCRGTSISFNEPTLSLEWSLDVFRLARRAGLYNTYVTNGYMTLVIPGVNDSDETLRSIAERIRRELGRDVPWHVTAYQPAYRFSAPPTPLDRLEYAWQAGKDAGLDFVYVGNVPGARHGDTHCPACGELLIERVGFSVVENRLRHGACPRCARPIPGVW